MPDDLATLRDNLDKITTEDFKILPNKNGLSYTVFFRLKLLRKSYLVFAKILAITDADEGKLKEKSLFNFDPSSFIKLRGYKVIPKDSNKSNIMKILFPHKKSADKRVKTDLKKVDTTSDEPMTSSVHDIKDLQKDFIEVDDILLVRDPSKVDSMLKNELDDDEPDQTPTSQYYQKENRKSAPRAIDLVLNQSLRLQKAAKGLNLSKIGNLDQLFRPAADRELFKREDTAKELQNRPVENPTDFSDDSRTERKSESSSIENPTNSGDTSRTEATTQSSSIEGRSDFGDDPTKVGQALNGENDKKDTENVAEQLQSVRSDVESSSTVESVKQDETTVNGDSATTSVPTDSLKIDVSTENVPDTTEKVGESQAPNESENKEEQMLGASLPSETSTESSQQMVQATPDQTTPTNDKDDSAKSDNEDDGMVGSPLQINADQMVRESLH